MKQIQCRATAARTLHLVDLENLLGDRRHEAVALNALSHYLKIAHWNSGDAVMVAADPEIIRQIGFDLPVPCNLRSTRGGDAADSVLLAQATAELVARRYDRLVIGSGDAIFLDRARTVRELGIGVLIVGRSDGVAGRYRRWAFPIIPFDAGVVTEPPGLAA
jgi:hypothetical protein